MDTPAQIPAQTPAYPVQLDVDYPDRDLNRLTTFFRIFTIIPIAIVLATVSGATQTYDGRRGRRTPPPSPWRPAACCSPGRC